MQGITNQILQTLTSKIKTLNKYRENQEYLINDMFNFLTSIKSQL